MIMALSAQPAHADAGVWLRLALVALGVLVLNLPFGFWRAGLRRFSSAWFVAVHAPVPLVVGLRLLAGVRFHPANLLVLATAFFTGQFCGGRLRTLRTRRGAGPHGTGSAARRQIERRRSGRAAR
jgi:hypothetical protein